MTIVPLASRPRRRYPDRAMPPASDVREFDIPGLPISLNRRTPTGQVWRKRPEEVEFKGRTFWAYRAAGFGSRKPLEGRLIAWVDYVMPRDSDIDNRPKVLMDALTGAGVWKDDRQVFELFERKWLLADVPRGEPRPAPFTRVRVMGLPVRNGPLPPALEARRARRAS